MEAVVAIDRVVGSGKPTRRLQESSVMASETLDIQRIDTRSTDWVERIERLREQLSPRGDVVSEQGRERTIEVFGEPLSPQRVVERICRDVRDQGVGAVLQYGRQLDGAELTADTLRVPSEVLANAHQRVDAEFLQTVRRIRANILEFQTALLQQDVEVRRADGTRLRQRYLPLRRVGVCVPGGAAAYPSTVLMTAVLAQAAGVAEIAVVAPPTEFGANNTDMLATCHELGIKEVYRVGGHRRYQRWLMAPARLRVSTRLSVRATCLSPWRKNGSTVKWTSTRLRVPVKW